MLVHQIENGTSSWRKPKTNLTPTLVPNLNNVSRIFSGVFITCAINLGSVVCWGSNSYGPLGNNNNNMAYLALSPEAVSNLSNIVRPGTQNSGHVSVIVGSGQLARGTVDFNRTNSTPQAAIGLSGGVTQLSCEDAFCCAVMNDTIAKCWGENTNGQLGFGFYINRASTPLQVKE